MYIFSKKYEKNEKNENGFKKVLTNIYVQVIISE